MSGLTLSSMHDARDAEDTRLLDDGAFAHLVESYYGVIFDRCRVRVWPEDQAIAVAGDVAIRLLAELKRGRRYKVPFRVVVHQVIGWKIKEHFAPAKLQEVELEEWLAVAAGETSGEIVSRAGFEAMLDGLTELERSVVELRYAAGLELAEIAQRLDRQPNAIHQIHYRALAKLRRAVAA